MTLAAALCAAAVAFGATNASAAEDVTHWDGDARSGVRLIAGARPAGAPHLRAGVEIRLDAGMAHLLALSRRLPACRHNSTLPVRAT